MDKLKTMEALLRAGKMDRRSFMSGALALGASMPAAMSMMGSALAAPKRGGRLRMGLTGGSTNDSLDPAQILDEFMQNVSFGQLRNCLTEVAVDGTIKGELAESWEASPDATVWTFKIRKGVEFHNGKTMDVTDVIESINHHRGEETKSAAKGIIESIEDIKADGDNVIFTLSGGSADFPYLLSDYHLGICPAKPGGGIDWESGVGTGGYSLVELEPGVRCLVKRNPNYWKADTCFFDEIESIQIADVNARTAALRTGSIDLMSNLDYKTVSLMKRSPGMKVIETKGNEHITLPMLTDTAPFDNNDLRLALKYSIDREKWLKTIFKGYGSLGNDHPIGAANQYLASGIEQRMYDPDKARHHLKKAGYDSIDLKLHMSSTAFDGAVDAGQLYQESAKACGVNIEVVREPADGYWSDVWLKKPWCASYWSGRPTEDWMFSQVYAKGVDWNETKWSHEQFQNLLLQARAELDSNKRREMYGEMQLIVRDHGGSVIPVFRSYMQALSDKVKTPEKLANNWTLDGYKCNERWWFDT